VDRRRTDDRRRRLQRGLDVARLDRHLLDGRVRHQCCAWRGRCGLCVCRSDDLAQRRAARRRADARDIPDRCSAEGSKVGRQRRHDVALRTSALLRHEAGREERGGQRLGVLEVLWREVRQGVVVGQREVADGESVARRQAVGNVPSRATEALRHAQVARAEPRRRWRAGR
jgi:hypothetical protein